MNLDTFKKVIASHLIDYPFSIIGIDDRIAYLLCMASSETYTESSEAKKTLQWEANDKFTEVAVSLITKYDIVLQAINEDTLLKIVTPENCDCMRELNNITLDPKDLLSAYIDKDSQFPLLPPKETICGFDQELNICSENILLVPVIKSSNYDTDQEFTDNIRKILRQGTKPDRELSSNWRENLLTDAINYIARKYKEAEQECMPQHHLDNWYRILEKALKMQS
jgi:hypothetical protein